MMSEREKELEELVRRLMVEIHPCRMCLFAFATHGRHDDAFETGAARLCEACAKQQKDGDWRPVQKTAYGVLIRRCLKALAVTDPSWSRRTLCTSCSEKYPKQESLSMGVILGLCEDCDRSVGQSVGVPYVVYKVAAR